MVRLWPLYSYRSYRLKNSNKMSGNILKKYLVWKLIQVRSNKVNVKRWNNAEHSLVQCLKQTNRRNRKRILEIKKIKIKSSWTLDFYNRSRLPFLVIFNTYTKCNVSLPASPTFNYTSSIPIECLREWSWWGENAITSVENKFFLISHH